MADASQNFIVDYDGTFFRGVKSDTDPSQLPVGYLWSSLNTINLGGVISTRPGYRCVVTFPDGNLQGAAIFRPLVGLEQLVVAIDGVLYVATWPFTEFRMIPNVQMSPAAKQVFWCLAVQSAERIATDLNSAIRARAPRAVLFVQDGGRTAPAYYDGSASGHIRDFPFETPAGGPMCWVGDRLWVATRNQVFASDIANPFSFREQIYLGGVSSFFFSSDVTALTRTPSINSPQLMVFTETDGSILQANIRDRDLWPTTVDFQREIIQVGCKSSRSVRSHAGKLVWFSPSGVAIFDPAASGEVTTRLPVRDNEMLISKTALGDDLELVAAGAFGQFLLISVPAEDQYNKHTWVLNSASFETLSDDSGPSWAGHWVGTRPVEWVDGPIAGQERIFHVSVDVDGKNRLWEAFRPDRLDNGCPITSAIFTRGYFGQTAPNPQKLPGQPCRMCWADASFAGMAEDLDVGVFYAGGSRGAFKQLMAKRCVVAKGSLSPDAEITVSTEIFAFKAQSRKLRSEDANQQSTSLETGSCGVEAQDLENIDESFQLLIVWHGPATIRWIRAFGLQVPEDWSGEPASCSDESGERALRFDGRGAVGDNIEEVVQSLTSPAPSFTAQKTETLSSPDGFSAVGIGHAESIVSESAADRVAGIIATKMAENELSQARPKVLSSAFE